MQKDIILKPLSVNTASDEYNMKTEEAYFIKGNRITINRNANNEAGSGSDMALGHNFGAGTPALSNMVAVTLPLPLGYNKCLGAYESEETNELYYFNYNDTLQHGIYILSGETLQVDSFIDPELAFSLDPRYAIPEHRVSLRVHYEALPNNQRKIKEKHLIFTDGNQWQRWINMKAAIGSKGFDAILFPYWKLQPPHFDRRELLEYAVRPPMFAPTFTDVPLTTLDKRKRNALTKRSTKFAIRYRLTDGRMTTYSQWSNPYFPPNRNTDNNAARCIELTLYAGSPMVEEIELFTRNCDSDWVRYDTIKKFPSCAENDPVLIGDEYWKRVKAWQDFKYDAVTNTIKYNYCGDKECALTSQEDARFQTDLPRRSVAQTTAGDAILFMNNEYDYDNFSCETMKNIKLNIETEAQAGCQPKIVKIRLYSMAAKNGYDIQFTYTDGDDKTMYWGGIINDPFLTGLTIDKDEAKMLNLIYANGGPIMYLAGTPYFAKGVQYKVSPDGSLSKVDVLDKSVGDQMNMARDLFQAGGYFVNVFDFEVPADNYVARMARHDVDLSLDYQQTSTYVMGIADSHRPGGFGYYDWTTLKSRSKEMIINACAGDVDVWNNGADVFYVFAPYDLKYGTLNAWNRWRFIEGYVREEKDTISTIGVELLKYRTDNGFPELTRDGDYTDHNGFYFAYTGRGDAKKAKVDFWGKYQCVMHNQNTRIVKSNDLPVTNSGWYKDNVILQNITGTFPICNRVRIRGNVVNTDGVGVEGVAITLSRGGTAYTASDGSFELFAHDSFEDRRLDRLYFNASSGDVLMSSDCGCIAPELYDSNSAPCIPCDERIYQTQIKRTVSVISVTAIGLKGGGRYAWTMVGYDLAGRATYANLIDYTDIPTIIETGVFTPPRVSASIIGKLNLPAEIAYVSFFRTRNLNYETYLQWVGDDIKYLDRDGNVIGSSAGAVRARVTIQSLLDYNIQNNFSTTVKYQFVRGDFIRIYDDGEGNYFKPDEKGFLDLQILGTNWIAANAAAGAPAGSAVTTPNAVQNDGATLIVPFDRRLETLKDKCGFWIEIARPNECKDKELYCEVSGMYPVINGEIAEKKIIFDTWDTYYQQRFIRNIKCSGKAILHPFESSSITDYWGENCSSCGRTQVRNPQAEARWFPDDTIKSDEWVNEGGYNGLGSFRSKNRKSQKGQKRGGIISAHAEQNFIFFLCQNDWYITDYQLNVARISGDGILLATLPQDLGDPHQKVGDNFGVEYEHTSAILYQEGKVCWGNAQNAGIIVCDYREAKDITGENRGYFLEKFKLMKQFNSCLGDDYVNSVMDFIFGYNPMHSEICVTFRPRRNKSVAPQSFANDEREVKFNHQETFTYNLEHGKWVRWEGFCPEAYGVLRHARSGSEMVAFAAGVPFFHNSHSICTYLNYFGVPTSRVIDLCIAQGDAIYQSIIVDDPTLPWFIDRMYTSERNSFSYVPLSFFKKQGRKWKATLLRDMNSYPIDSQPYRVMLHDGKRISGGFLRLRLVAHPGRSAEYSELNNIVVRVAAQAPQTTKQ